jgi:capsular polysaccharide biosynthesis protein/Mrp family chromosome partitioning ATPase
MNPSQRPDSFDLADYTGVLRRRWWVVVAGAIIGLVAALAYVEVAPKTYTATTAVYVSPTGNDQNNQVANSRTGGGSVNLDTEAQIVTSGTVAAMAAHTLHSPLTPWSLSKEITVTVPPNSQVLDIACSASSAKGAAACAQAFANAYLLNRGTSSTAALKAQVTNLQSELNGLQKTVTALNAKDGGLPSNSPTRISNEATVSSDQSQVHSLDSRIASLNSLAADNSGGHIITAASLPGSPSKPKKSLVLPSGLAAGLVLGLIVAFVWDRRDKHIRNPRDVQRFLDLPVMLSLPENTFAKQQVSLVMPRSSAGRAFTELGHSLTTTLGDGNHVIFVTSAVSGPGASFVAANLAATLARTHPDVVLVCADLNGGVAPEMLGLEEGPGLAEVVTGAASVREVVHNPAAVPSLWVIPPGDEESLSAYYIEHDRAQALVAQLRKDARYVVIEAQAVGEVADTFAFAEFADGALLVVESSRTERDEAVRCARRVQRLGAPILGVALLPALGRRIKVRPPRQGQPQPERYQGNGDRRAVPSGGQGQLPAMSATSAGAKDRRRGRSARSGSDAGYEDHSSDRVYGS